MKNKRLFTSVFVFLCIVAFTGMTHEVAVSKPLDQAAGNITGTGQINYGSEPLGTIEIKFNPAGGPVTGTFSLEIPTYEDNDDANPVIGKVVSQGTLEGTFTGGDEGTLKGTAASGTTVITYFVECDTCKDGSFDEKGTLWEGILRADGTGDGWFKNGDFLWQITFSPADFQAGLQTNTNPSINTTTGSQGSTDTTSSEYSNGHSIAGYKDFNPFAGADEASLYVIGAFVFGLLYIIIMIILLVKK